MRRKPFWAVPVSVERFDGKRVKCSVPVYGNYRNQWIAQACAAKKFDAVRRDFTGKYQHKMIPCGRTFIDAPRRLESTHA